MNIIVKRAVLYYCDQYPKARIALLTWYHEFLKHEFRNFNELKSVYGSASLAGLGRVVFNIKGNEFRLIVSINFHQMAAYIIWFGTHNEYDKIKAETIRFNTKIVSYKSRKR
ncbi:MAG: type II toxin-antitoxin system HigB family toxin [Saprospiraceae bacterium]